MNKKGISFPILVILLFGIIFLLCAIPIVIYSQSPSLKAKSFCVEKYKYAQYFLTESSYDESIQSVKCCYETIQGSKCEYTKVKEELTMFMAYPIS